MLVVGVDSLAPNRLGEGRVTTSNDYVAILHR